VKTRTSNLADRRWICLGLGLITLAVYWPSLTHGFLAYDDQAYVTENPQVRAGLTWPGVVWAFKSFSVANWHPLTWLSHMLDCQLYGLNPAGHRLTNLLLHTASTLLLFLFLNRITGALWRSACVAALFAWHPLHVESVAWVAERKDVLSAFFFMLTLWSYGRYAESRTQEAEASTTHHVSRFTFHASRLTFHASRFYLFSLLFFALGLMSKPMLVTLPFVLLLLDYWPLRRVQLSTLNPQPSTLWRLVVEKLPFLGLSAVACVLTVAAQRQGFAVVLTAGLPLSFRIPHVLVSYVHYLGVMLLPRHLAAHYPYVAAVPAFEVAGAAILLALLTFLAFYLAARRPYLVVGWLWYLGTLVPVIGLVQVGDQAWADRYSYIPLIGLFVAAVWGVGDLAEAWASRRMGPGASAVMPAFPLAGLLLGAVAAAVGVAMLVATSLQLRYWKNTRTLFEHAAAVTQNNTRALTVLGSLQAADGKLEEAKRLYAQALSHSPDNPETHFNLGKLLDQEGKLDEAIAEYSRSLWSRQWQDKVHILIGVALAKEHKYAEAAAHYQAALALNPESATAENNLARVLHSQGKLDEAMKHYEAALKLDPQLAQAQNNLGVLLLQQVRLAEGVPHLREAVRLMPGDAESQYNLAVALNQQENWKEAAASFARLAPGRPNDAKLHYEFGLALAHLGQTREAMSHYARALRLQPDFPEALDRLAWIAATDSRPELRNGTEAVNMAQRACELTEHKQAQYLATLAAAYAEAGQSAEAVSAAETAGNLAASAGQKEMAAKCGNLLEALKSSKPWRETLKAPADGPSSSR
jgi:tetratricopeptide (TPR) repeat protein